MRKKGVVLAYGPRWIRKSSEINGFDRIPRMRGGSVGLYVLYKNKRITYIGKSETNIGKRLSNHTKDHLKNKWDAFSWFITRGKYVADLEALLHRTPFKIEKPNKIRAKFIEAKRFGDDKKR